MVLQELAHKVHICNALSVVEFDSIFCRWRLEETRTRSIQLQISTRRLVSAMKNFCNICSAGNKLDDTFDCARTSNTCCSGIHNRCSVVSVQVRSQTNAAIKSQQWLVAFWCFSAKYQALAPGQRPLPILRYRRLTVSFNSFARWVGGGLGNKIGDFRQSSSRQVWAT